MEITLKQHLDRLTELVKKNPKLKDMKIIYSTDSEGNHFENVVFKATSGMLSEGGEFFSEQEIYGKNPDVLQSKLAINCVCIN